MAILIKEIPNMKFPLKSIEGIMVWVEDTP